MTEHDIVLMVQRQIIALQTQIAGLVAERDLLREQVQQLTAALSELSARNDKTALNPIVDCGLNKT